MKIDFKQNKIEITNPQDFDVLQTLSCGQIFRYTIDGNSAVVYSQNRKAILTWDNDKIEIETKDINYFYNF